MIVFYNKSRPAELVNYTVARFYTVMRKVNNYLFQFYSFAPSFAVVDQPGF